MAVGSERMDEFGPWNCNMRIPALMYRMLVCGTARVQPVCTAFIHLEPRLEPKSVGGRCKWAREGSYPQFSVVWLVQ